MESEKPSQGIRIAAVLISILLAWLTYRLIEKTIRLGKHGKVKTITLLILMIIVGYVGYSCYKKNGLGFRLQGRQEYSEYFENSSPKIRYMIRTGIPEKYRIECTFQDFEKLLLGQVTLIPRNEISKYCFERNKAYNHAVFIWGDSHAQQLNFGLKNNLPPDWQILQVASPACKPDPDVKQPSTIDYCIQSNWFALKAMSEVKPDVVIAAQITGYSIDSFNRIAKKLKELGVKKIIFMGSVPIWTSDLPKIILKKLWINTPRRTYVGIDKKVLADNAILQEQFKQTDTEIFVNLSDSFCNKDGCLTYIGDDKKTGITTFDTSHLAPIASDYLAKKLLVDLIVGNNAKNE
jgi:hypothetical protein